MHQKHNKNLKSQLKDYNVDPFEDSSAVYKSTGQEIDCSISSRSTPSFGAA